MDPYHNFYRGAWERVTIAYNFDLPICYNSKKIHYCVSICLQKRAHDLEMD